MSPDRKRKIRLVLALSAAVLLAVALIYTSFSASSEAKEPSQLLNAAPGQSYEMTGVVVPGSIHRHAGELNFRVADRDNSCGGSSQCMARNARRSASIPVRYRGEVPDPFADGREIIITGTVASGTFMAQRDSLITKCPSKFSDQAQQDPQHVIISK